MVVAAVLAAQSSARAAPVGVILADLEADPAQRELAGSLGLLVRSMLAPGQRALIPTRELALALEVASGGRRRETLTVIPAQAKPLMERLNCDRVFIGTLKVDQTQWEVRGQILGPEGTRLTTLAAQVPPNELHALATQLAQRLAARLALNIVERPPVTLSAMAPYARAQAAINGGEPKAAAKALELADPRPMASLSSAKEVVEGLASNPNLPPPSRMQMSLLAGDNAGARHTADEILKADPKNVQARASKVRAMANQGDVEAALGEFEQIKGSKDPFAAVANAALLIKRRHSPDRAALAQGHLSEDAQAEALAMSMKDPDSDNTKTLAFISSASPNALPPAVEVAAVGAAEQVAAKDPALASSVATRALKGGVQVDKALPLAQVHKLDKTEVAAVKDKLEAIGPKGETAMKALGLELEKRDGLAQKLRLGGVDMPPIDVEMEPLAVQLRGLLANFGVLQEQMGPRAMVVSKQETSASWYQPFRVRRPRLERGLLRAMWEKPYEMGLVLAPAGAEVVSPANLTEIHLGNLVENQGADLVIVHSERADGLDVEVELILFDGTNGTAYRTSGKVAGMGNRLLSVNAIPFGLFGLVVAVPLGLLRLRKRAGEINVKVQASDTSERMLCILISESPKPPKVTDPKQFAEDMDKLGAKKDRLSATLVENNTSFERIPPGRWYVHLYGTYRTGKITHIVSGDEFSQRVEVKQQKEHNVLFSVAVTSAEFHVTVMDNNRPLVGVPVWVDEERDKAVRTNDDGLAVLKVTLGQRKLRVEAGGMLVEKNHVVIKRKAHVIAINLDWERKVDDVSRALDNDPDVIASRSSATMPLQSPSSSATMPVQPGASSATMRAPSPGSSATMPAQPAASSATMRQQPPAVVTPAQPQDDGSISLGLDLDMAPPAAPKPPADLPPIDLFAPPTDEHGPRR
jgi:hypothetical protein